MAKASAIPLRASYLILDKTEPLAITAFHRSMPAVYPPRSEAQSPRDRPAGVRPSKAPPSKAAPETPALEAPFPETLPSKAPLPKATPETPTPETPLRDPDP